MADMYGAICSNNFIVKDVAAFKAWFEQYYWGEDVCLDVQEDEKCISIVGYTAYPSAYPQYWDEATGYHECVEDLVSFCASCCEHLAEGEFIHLVSGGNEKLRYCAFDRLIIHSAYPDDPLYEAVSSESDGAEIERIMQVRLSASQRL